MPHPTGAYILVFGKGEFFLAFPADAGVTFNGTKEAGSQVFCLSRRKIKKTRLAIEIRSRFRKGTLPGDGEERFVLVIKANKANKRRLNKALVSFKG